MLKNKMQNISFNKITKFNKYFLIYLLFLGFCGIVFLYSKYDVSNDSTISEWLINYQGGFTRRGLIGEICFHLAKFFKTDLRFVIFLLQVFTYLTFLFLTYNFFKNLNINSFLLFVIFTPIFLLYPVAEIEVLARKELFLYIYFLCFLILSNPNSNYHKYVNLYIVIITPIVCMIYEEIILFFPFIVACLITQRNVKKFSTFFKICFLFLPSILIIIYFFLFPLTIEDHNIMKESLLSNFNEKCYMSCSLLIINDINQFGTMIDFMYGKNSTQDILKFVLRYFLIILIGFFPLFFISYHSKFKNENIFSIFKFKNILFLILFLFIPVIPLFIFAYDWGRWVGMMISFSIFFYFFLYKYQYIDVDFKTMSNRLIFLMNKKKLVIFIFIIFAFGWNQKTVMSGDVATNPLWKVPYNTSKLIFGVKSFRIFQDSPLILWHRKYIE